jgi:hypothetical protein
MSAYVSNPDKRAAMILAADTAEIRKLYVEPASSNDAEFDRLRNLHLASASRNIEAENLAIFGCECGRFTCNH